jgi:nucleotide-binding universal stress UspA family protein
MFKKILVPTDGSDKALQAADVARELGEKFSSHVILLNVLQPFYEIPALATGDMIPPPVLMMEDLEASGKNALTRTQSQFKDYAFPVTTRSEWGNPAERIVTVAKEEAVDVIIIGNRGITGLEEFLLGSVSSQVVHEAPCSVIVVR